MNRMQDKQKLKSNLGIGITSDVIEDATMYARGEVQAYSDDGFGGDAILHHHKKNLIVKLGAVSMAHLLAEGTATKVITKYQFGTKGHVLSPEDLLTPVAPSEDDTKLIDTIPVAKNFATGAPFDFTYLTAPASALETRVQYTLTLELAEGNDAGDPAGVAVPYTEAALICGDDSLFARETFASINKTDSRRLIFRWTIIFS